MGVWPALVGRDDELEELASELLHGGRGDHGAPGMVLVGDAGVGKTRLLDELVNRANGAGWRTRVLHASGSGSVVPLGCLSPLLASRSPTDRPAPSPEVLFHEALRSLLAEANGSGPWLLAVDDLPQLDAPSAAVLHQCLVTTHVPFIGTARHHEDRPDALDALWHQGRLRLREVPPLSDGAMSDLVVALVGGPVDPPSMRRLLDLSAGNPLTLRELIASTRDTAALVRRNGIWSLADGYQAGVQIRALVDRRLALVDPQLRGTLELIALGEPVPLMGLSALVGGDELIDELVYRSLVTIDDRADPVTVRSSHPLFGEVLRAQLPPGRRARLSAELEPLLPSGPEGGSGFVRRAVLHLDSGSPHDANLLASAAVAARHAGDHALALRLAGTALDLTDDHIADGIAVDNDQADDDAGDARFGAALITATVDNPSSDDSSRSRFEHALDCARTEDETLAVLGEWAWVLLAAAGLEATLEMLAAHSTRVRTPSGRMSIEVLGATMTAFAGRWGSARDQLADILERLPETETAISFAALSTHALACNFDGPSGQALISARRAEALSNTAGWVPPIQIVTPRAAAIYATGQVEGFRAGRRVAQRVIDLSTSGAKDTDFIGMYYSTVSGLTTTMCSLERSGAEDAARALDLLRWRDPYGLLGIAVANVGLFGALTGDRTTAARYLDEYDSNFRPVEAKSTTLGDRGRAWQCFDAGDLDGAVGWTDRAWAGSWVHAEVALWAAPVVHDLVRFGRPDAAIDRLDAAHGRLRSPFSAALADHARALAAGDLAAVVDAGDALSRLGATALAAEAFAQAAALTSGSERDQLQARARNLIDNGLLPTPVLRSLLDDLGPAATTGDDVAPVSGIESESQLVRLESSGRSWQVAFGSQTAAVRDLTGMRYLAALVACPHQPIRSSVLVSGAELPPTTPQPVLDVTAQRALRSRALELVEQLREARSAGASLDEIDRLEDEAEALRATLQRDGSLHGAARTFAGADERARTSVRKAIVRAIDEIRAVHPAAAEHLGKTIATGMECSYCPPSH